MGVKQKLWGSGYWQKSSCEYRKSKKKDDRPREMGLQLEGWAFQLLSQCTVFIAYTDLGFLLARAAWYVPMPAFQPHLFPTLWRQRRLQTLHCNNTMCHAAAHPSPLAHLYVHSPSLPLFQCCLVFYEEGGQRSRTLIFLPHMNPTWSTRLILSSIYRTFYFELFFCKHSPNWNASSPHLWLFSHTCSLKQCFVIRKKPINPV